MDMINRGTGLLIIEARMSNPNGDPDMDSDPRHLPDTGHGLITGVSVKRKVRDLILDKEGPAWQIAQQTLNVRTNGRAFDIVEAPGLTPQDLKGLSTDEFLSRFWDSRIFGSMELVADKGAREANEDASYKSMGPVQFGMGVSVAPVEVERLTTTNASGVEQGKNQGMAPLGHRVVRHGLYAMPFHVNPAKMAQSGATPQDVDLMLFLLPYIYRLSTSASRPEVEIRHAWYARHTSPLGSVPAYRITEALTPRLKDETFDAPLSIADYDVPTELPGEVFERLDGFVDLADHDWASGGVA